MFLMAFLASGLGWAISHTVISQTVEAQAVRTNERGLAASVCQHCAVSAAVTAGLAVPAGAGLAVRRA